MKVKIEKWGDGLGIRLPSTLLVMAGLVPAIYVFDVASP
jgi:antitoxin component of MazEF toxin-antitoxin module